MPGRSGFIHLSEKKKEMIREAAVQEFIRVSPEQASINQIVRNAEISRGSFYTYFEDKEDLMRYVFEDLIRQVREFCKNLLRDSGGDFWTLQQGLMDFVLQICREDKMPALTRTESGHNTLMRLMWERKDGSDEVCPEEIWLGELYQLTDCSRLRVGSLQEYRILFSICIHCILAEIAELYERGKDGSGGPGEFCQTAGLYPVRGRRKAKPAGRKARLPYLERQKNREDRENEEKSDCSRGLRFC